MFPTVGKLLMASKILQTRLRHRYLTLLPVAEWKIRSESPDITCVMTENGPRFEVEEGSEGLERYAEAKSIADRLNANIGRVSELLRETSPKTEFTQS